MKHQHQLMPILNRQLKQINRGSAKINSTSLTKSEQSRTRPTVEASIAAIAIKRSARASWPTVGTKTDLTAWCATDVTRLKWCVNAAALAQQQPDKQSTTVYCTSMYVLVYRCVFVCLCTCNLSNFYFILKSHHQTSKQAIVIENTIRALRSPINQVL